MTAYENLALAVENGIGTITINRPKVLNALNTATLRELKSAALDMQNNDDVKVIILTGAERAFAAGADIAEMMPMTAIDRKSTRLNSSHSQQSRMPSSA